MAKIKNSALAHTIAPLKTRAQIIRAIRKQRGMNQAYVARSLGYGQPYISKIESAQIDPDTSFWFEFCALVELDPLVARRGYIDQLSEAEHRSEAKEHGFPLPSRYRKNRGIKVRSLFPLLKFFRLSQGEEALENYLKELKLDPDFFVNLDNQINFSFLGDLVEHMLEKRILSSDQIASHRQELNAEDFHGRLAEEYRIEPDLLFRFQYLCRYASLYDCDFHYELENPSGAHFHLILKPHSPFKNSPFFQDTNVTEFLTEWKRSFFDTLTQLDSQETQKGKVTCIQGFSAQHPVGYYRIEKT